MDLCVSRAVRGGFPCLGQISLVSARFPWSRSSFPNLSQEDRISVSPIPVHLPPSSRTDMSDESLIMDVDRPPLGS